MSTNLGLNLPPDVFNSLVRTAGEQNTERQDYYCKIGSIFYSEIKYHLVECYLRPQCHKHPREYLHELWIKKHGCDPPSPPRALGSPPPVRLDIPFSLKPYVATPWNGWGVPILGSLSGMECFQLHREDAAVLLPKGWPKAFILLIWDNVVKAPHVEYVRINCGHGSIRLGQLAHLVATVIYDLYLKAFGSDEKVMKYIRNMFIRGLQYQAQQPTNGVYILRAVTELAPYC